LASSDGARIQISRSSSVVRITGIALGWMGLDDRVPRTRTRIVVRIHLLQAADELKPSVLLPGIIKHDVELDIGGRPSQDLRAGRR